MLYLALFIPFLSFTLLALTSFKSKWAALMGCGSVFISFLCFTILALTDMNQTVVLYNWISLEHIQAEVSLHVDHLSLLMSLIVTGVGFLIHVYSIGYMEEEDNLNRYFACMNLFIFAMLLLVLAGDLLLLFVGWEGVGLASYLLIGYWYEKPSAAKAATKAFIVNRIGDLGFLLGIILALTQMGTTNIDILNTETSGLLTLLLLCGAIAKSAQIPLHVWLPDAMEGPTPVSALIHAATMVTAGVYLIARLHPLFLASPATLQLTSILGGATSLFAAICALNQTDLKRVLAYSTISQLGLMFLACGVGAFYAAMFHLTTHAFMKALLFLSAGNVIHRLHGVTEMGKMGGLAKQFPTTHWLFLIGVLAMAGIPPFAAFFSKDLILEVEYGTNHMWLFYTAIATSILTAIYLMRAYILTFRGPCHIEAIEAPSVMLVPIKTLAFLAIFGGFLGYLGAQPFLENYLVNLTIIPQEREFTHNFWSSTGTWLSILMATLGVGIGAFLKFQSIPFLKNGMQFDILYQKLIITPYTMLSNFIAKGIEPLFFEKMVIKSSLIAIHLSLFLQKLQNGQIRSYSAWMIIGGVCLLIYFVRPYG